MKTRSLTPKIRADSKAWALTEIRMTAVLADTVDNAVRMWPELIRASDMSIKYTAQLLEHLAVGPSAPASLQNAA